MDFFATADTACLGTRDEHRRSGPSRRPACAFDPANPNNDPAHHGPIIAILGQGAQPGNGADFRGFIALDIRNFATTDLAALLQRRHGRRPNANTLKALEANWVTVGGYPGPTFPPAITPPDPNDQVAIIDRQLDRHRRSTRSTTRFVPGDEILVAVYPGNVMAIPDFTISPPAHDRPADDRHDREAAR